MVGQIEGDKDKRGAWFGSKWYRMKQLLRGRFLCPDSE